MIAASLLACASPLATVPGATRLAELGNGTLLVGTEEGAVVALDWYGSVVELADAGGPVRDLAGGPLANYAVLRADGRVLAGTPWQSSLQHVSDDAIGIFWSCDGLVVGTRAAPDPWSASATAVAIGDRCGDVVLASASGAVDGHRVTDAPVRRVQRVGSGTLWVDDRGRQGCLDCDLGTRDGVVDALALHVPPFVAGGIAWLDRSGSVWLR